MRNYKEITNNFLSFKLPIITAFLLTTIGLRKCETWIHFSLSLYCKRTKCQTFHNET